jgi:hypothetical protein
MKIQWTSLIFTHPPRCGSYSTSSRTNRFSTTLLLRLSQQLPCFESQTCRNTLEVQKGNVLLTPLNCSHVGTVDPNMICESLLRKLLGVTEPPHSLPELFL